MLFPMLPGAKSYDQPIASYMAFKLGVTLFSITLYYILTCILDQAPLRDCRESRRPAISVPPTGGHDHYRSRPLA